MSLLDFFGGAANALLDKKKQELAAKLQSDLEKQRMSFQERLAREREDRDLLRSAIDKEDAERNRVLASVYDPTTNEMVETTGGGERRFKLSDAAKRKYESDAMAQQAAAASEDEVRRAGIEQKRAAAEASRASAERSRSLASQAKEGKSARPKIDPGKAREQFDMMWESIKDPAIREELIDDFGRLEEAIGEDNPDKYYAALDTIRAITQGRVKATSPIPGNFPSR